MPNSIPLHPKYGLNPTISTCFYCGKETGEIALLGAKYKDEAPKHSCTSLKPCSECMEKFKDSVVLIETQNNDENIPQVTGRWIVVKKECIAVPNDGICFVDTATMNELINLSNN